MTYLRVLVVVILFGVACSNAGGATDSGDSSMERAGSPGSGSLGGGPSDDAGASGAAEDQAGGAGRGGGAVGGSGGGHATGGRHGGGAAGEVNACTPLNLPCTSSAECCPPAIICAGSCMERTTP